MKWIWILCIISLLSGILNAQEEDQTSYFRFVNLIDPGEGKTFVKIDGRNFFPMGYELGIVTGEAGFKPGTKTFVVSKEGCLTAERKIDLRPREVVTLVGYAEPVYDDNGEIIDWQIKIARLSQHDSKNDYYVTVVSFLNNKEPIPVSIIPVPEGKEVKLFVPNRKATRAPFSKKKTRAKVVVNGETITGLKGRRAGNYVVMLYHGKDEKVKGLAFYDASLLIQD